MTERRHSYNPYKLIDEIVDLLRSNGVDANSQPGHVSEAVAGTGQLLRSLGVEPLMDPLDSFERTNSRVWSEDG